MSKIKNILILTIIVFTIILPITVNAQTFTYSHYCICKLCCGKDPSNKNYGRTASEVIINENNSLCVMAVPDWIPFGTIIHDKTNNRYYLACDTGGKLVKAGRLDLAVAGPNAHSVAKDLGVRTFEGVLYENKILPNGYKRNDENIALLQKYSESQALLAQAIGHTVVVPDESQVEQPPEVNVIPNFEVKLNGQEINADTYGSGSQLGIGMTDIKTIELIDESSIKGYVTAWVIYDKNGNPQYISDVNGKATINFGEEGYEKYINPKNNLITLEQKVVGNNLENTKQIKLSIEHILQDVNFETKVNGKNINTQNIANNGITIIEENIISNIELRDTTNISGRVKAWRLWNVKNQSWDEKAYSESAIITWDSSFNEKYISTDGIVEISLITYGGAKEDVGYKIIKIKLNTEATDKGMLLKVINGTQESAYAVQEGQENVILIKANSRIEMSGSNIAKYRIWDVNNLVEGIIPNGKINNVAEYFYQFEKVDIDTYKARLGITRENGTKEGYDIRFELVSNDINVILSGKAFEGSKANPLHEGSKLSEFIADCKAEKSIRSWEVKNQITGTYELIAGNEKTKAIPVNERNYKLIDANKYLIELRVVLEDNQVINKEIYFNLVQIENIYNTQKIDSNKDLEIKWNAEAGRKYFIRMVKLSEQGNNIEIEPGKVVEGNSYTIPSNKLDKDSNYRIALKDNDGQYYHIIIISTMEVNGITIVNYDEIRQHNAGKELKIKIAGKNPGDKYQITLFNEQGRVMWVYNTDQDEIVLMKADEAVKGKYKIGISVIRLGIASDREMFDIEIKNNHDLGI
ncbi:MAG: hypothetical protein E7311_02385 [Clostridiales bacterium]|nr:hypothetical protein [Clostridiales bacterium]